MSDLREFLGRDRHLEAGCGSVFGVKEQNNARNRLRILRLMVERATACRLDTPCGICRGCYMASSLEAEIDRA